MGDERRTSNSMWERKEMNGERRTRYGSKWRTSKGDEGRTLDAMQETGRTSYAIWERKENIECNVRDKRRWETASDLIWSLAIHGPRLIIMVCAYQLQLSLDN